ncbi:MAG: HypC/HybG/HupF family hydrogenase formation chaperone [Actinomycetia bacterium]|nr:HypC/HybG/HupF family hydrogenase formation chaperone [Actinomycetes bacterium]
MIAQPDPGEGPESTTVAYGQDERGCLTCADEAVACTVVRPPSSAAGTTLVETPWGPEEVDTTLVGEVRPGDLVLVHAKTAIATLAPERWAPARLAGVRS